MKRIGIIQKYLLILIALSICLLLMVSCTASPTIPPAANGEELRTYQMDINLLGTEYEATVDSQGRLKTSAQVTSADGRISLSLNEETTVLDKEAKPLKAIDATIDSSPPPPPEDSYIVGAVYDLRPSGATVHPSLTLTLSYDPNELPQGLGENDIYIAGYEDSKWEMVRYKQVDTERHKVTTQIEHFARFAVLAPAPAGEHPTSENPSLPADRVEVVYFHRPQRCSGCLYAETATRYTVENYFEDELASKKLVFKVVNLGDKANAAIVEQYGAYTSSLFINDVKDNVAHIEEVKEIWFLLGNDEEFVGLVKSKIEMYLGGES